MKICWMLKKTLTRILVVSAAFTMFIGLPLQTVSADTIEWRMNSVWVPSRLEAKAMDLFANRINEKAKGRLNVTVYHGGSKRRHTTSGRSRGGHHLRRGAGKNELSNLR